MSEAFTLLGDALWSPLSHVIGTDHTLSWFFISGSLVLAGIIYVTRPSLQARYTSLIGYLLPKQVWQAKSAHNDLVMYVVNSIVFFLLVALIHFDPDRVSAVWAALLPAEDAPVRLSPSWSVRLGITVGSIVVMDLAVFLVHYTAHRNKILWEFHKVHHSAEVLVPFTLLRMHPIEKLAYAVVGSVMIGTYIGVLTWLYGSYETLLLLGILGVLNAVTSIVYNLHHSHVYLRFPGPLRFIFYSPAHHHIHHSSAPEHFDKNFGVMFTCWDLLFGTHFDPPIQEPELELGVYGEPNLHPTVWSMYLMPFVGAWQLVRGTKETLLPPR